MVTYKDQFWINSDPSDVFEELAAPRLWHSVLGESDTDSASDDFPVEYSHRLGKQRLSLTEQIGDEHIEFEDTGAFDATYTLQVEPQGSGTKVEFDTEYSVTIPLIQRIAGGLVQRYITGQIESMLDQLQAELRTRQGTVESAAAA